MFAKQAAIAKLRVNVKSLSAEAKAIRFEIRRVRDKKLKDALAWHRAYELKHEARTAHLALACAKGVPYRHAEEKVKSEPDFERVGRKIKKMMLSGSDQELFRYEVVGWFENARGHIKSQELGAVSTVRRSVEI